MKVEVWSDYACPFCYIGERKLEQALNQLDMTQDTEIVFRSFELDPNAPLRKEGNINALMAAKYGMSLERATATNNQIIESAKAVGLTYDFDNLKPTNTFDAHRLSHYAKIEGKLNPYTEAVMQSYFTDSELISDHEVLANLAQLVGLDRDRALEILRSDAYSEEVRKDEKEAHERQINGVPYFLFDGNAAVYGAQPVEVFVETIESLK